MTLCVHWPRLGPYHLARLAALHAYLVAQGGTLVALETAGVDLYAWDVESAETPYRRQTLFAGQTFEDVPARAMHDAVTAALDAMNPDAVAITSYSTPDARAALAWCRRRRRTAVMMFDSRAEDAARSGWREAVKRQIVRQYDAACVAGTPHAAYAHALGIPADALFMPLDVVNNAHFARPGPPRPDLPGLADPRPFFLASNRFVARKNVRGLLRAYARYRADAPTGAWRLVLLGDGPERDALEADVRAGAIPDVTFAGFQQIAALPAYYAAAGAFVHPALADQWGLVVNEAMAAGLPVVVSTGTGCAHDLVRGNGFTFDPAGTAHLSDLLGQVAALPDGTRAEMGDASRAIIAGYRPEDFAEQICRAAEHGRTRADRGLTLGGRLTLGALRLAARDARAFHTIPE